MKQLVRTAAAALLFTLAPFTLTSWGQAAPPNAPAPEKPAERPTHHKAHPAERHAAHPAERHAAHPAQRHAPHDAERHAQRHGKRHHPRHTGA